MTRGFPFLHGIFKVMAVRATRCSHSIGCFIMIAVVLCLFPIDARGKSTTILRIGFSSTVFGEVNQNDAVASVRAWTQALAKERNISADPEPLILNGTAEIREALSNKALDCINLRTSEYAELRDVVIGDSVVTGVVSNSITEEYVLVIRRNSGITKLSDLQGRKLAVLDSARACLASVWLDTILLQDGLRPAADFFGKIDLVAKINKAVLPLFFGRLDACLVTQRGFDIMVELNPQTGQQLEVLAVSPPVVPIIFIFCGDENSPVRREIMDEIKSWHLSPAGQQSLTIFQTDSLEENPISCLDSALELLSKHKLLIGAAGGSRLVEK